MKIFSGDRGKIFQTCNDYNTYDPCPGINKIVATSIGQGKLTFKSNKSIQGKSNARS